MEELSGGSPAMWWVLGGLVAVTVAVVAVALVDLARHDVRHLPKLAFAIAVVAVVAGYTRGLVGTIAASVVVLLLFPLAALVGPVRPWLPSSLISAVLPLLEGARATEMARAVLVTLVATPALLALAVHRLARREL